MKLYVAGPMSSIGPPTWNHPAFFRAAAELRCAGHEVICPAELHAPDSSIAWDWYLRRDIQRLVECDGIVMLSDWENSKGATLEHHIASALGMHVFYTSGDVTPESITALGIPA